MTPKKPLSEFTLPEALAYAANLDQLLREALRERDVARAALTAICHRAPIMGSKGDYREGQLHALEACREVAARAGGRSS